MAAAAASLATGLGRAQTAAEPLPPPSPPLLRMGYTNSLWPLSRAGDDGAAEGLLVELVAGAAARAGLGVRNRAYPWARAQLMVQHGELDGFSTVRTQERLAYAQFCPTPLVSFRIGVFHRADDARPRALHSVADMRALRQGTYRGNGYAKENLEWQRVRVENDQATVLRLITMGSLDVFASAEFTGAAYLLALGLADKLRFTPLPFLPPAEYRFGLRKSFDHADTVLARMEAAAQALHKAGEADAVMRRYQQLFKEVHKG